ncbi:MAG: hypothetical protein JRF33_26415 [Deltaproteobacteria bacterium]|nr:hypothetical protein [Deltaproteobacteria bacterium]
MNRDVLPKLVLLVLGCFFLLAAACSGDGTLDGGSPEDATTDGTDDGGGLPDEDPDEDAGVDASDDAGGGDTQGDVDPVDAGEDAGGDTGEDAGGDTGGDSGGDVVVTHECSAGEVLCVDHATRRYCGDTPSGRRWLDETCDAGAGCVRGECVAGSCSDACNLGDTAGGQTCELFDIGSGSWLGPDPAGSMHDRSRAYNMWLRRDSLYFGGVGNAIYSDPPNYTNVISHGGMGDSAIWTGTYLAAEALRLKATGSADARQNVIDLINTLHLLFNVSGSPGVLQRWAAPSGQHSGTELDCSDPHHHCNVQYEGNSYDVMGHISRDQYQGVMLGYALAYEALSAYDENTKALIREDVVEFVEELMKERTVPLQITWNGTDWPIREIETHFMVLCEHEMTPDGAIHLQLDTNDYENSSAQGYQEFIPNWGDMISQIPGLGLLTFLPRGGSGVMLASYFRVAMLVTEDAPGYEARHAAFRDFYYNNPVEDWGNVNDWIEIIDGWFYTDDCGGSYYGNNIVMEPMFNWARLEDDPDVMDRILDEVLGPRMWTEHQNTKNSFFFYMYAAIDPMTYANAAQIAGEQLAGFPPPPRVKVPVDLRNDSRYFPHESDCTDQTDHDGAVDVADRVVRDFIWQRNPWELYDPGIDILTFPGVDYLVAYWMGRRYEHLQDDTSGTCLAWR